MQVVLSRASIDMSAWLTGWGGGYLMVDCDLAESWFRLLPLIKYWPLPQGAPIAGHTWEAYNGLGARRRVIFYGGAMAPAAAAFVARMH